MSDEAARLYRVFDPGPLSADDVDLYVDLDAVRGEADVVNRLARRIRLSDSPTCQLLAGHHGSGKSTELRRLQRRLETGTERRFVVFCQSDDDIDRNDVDFPEVLIAIVRQLAAQVKERADIRLKPGYFKDLPRRFGEFLSSEVEFDRFELDTGLGKFSADLKGSPEARSRVRKALEPDTGNLLHAANDVIGEAILRLQTKGYHGLVILVDDLDKMVLREHAGTGSTTAEYLFIHRHGQLSGFKCHVVYTMPLALAYSAQERRIASLYGSTVPVIPMTRISTPPPRSRPYKPGIEKLDRIIDTRLHKVGVASGEVFTGNGVRARLIALSGGQPRELMILIREAIIGGDLPIGDEAVGRAAREGRRAYARQLRQEHWPIIREVHATGGFTRTATNDEVIRELLDSRAILQYANTDQWYGVNPLIELPKAASRPKARPRAGTSAPSKKKSKRKSKRR